MMLAAPTWFAAPGDLAPDLRHLLHWGAWVMSLPVVGFAAAPFFGGAWRALRQRRIGTDLPVAIGIAVMFVASTGAAFDPHGPFGAEVYFDSLTMFIAFLLIGRYLEMHARQRAAVALEDTMGRMPASALRLSDEGADELVGVHRLQPGDRVRVPSGQAFAADGCLIEGCTEADESLLSGEARPVPKRPGAPVVAGSLNCGAPVVMRVERVGLDTRYEAIVSLMREALSQRPSIARSADRWAGPFLWAVLLMAAGAGAVWSVVEPARAVSVAVSVLIVTCPCALSLAVPSALVAAAGALARRGILLRRLDALEPLARADRLFIDKTGTLTDLRLVLRAAHRIGAAGAAPGGPGPADATLLQQAASLAAWSSHPLAQALCDAVPASQPALWSQVHEELGAGLSALDAQGRCWRLGSAAWLGRPDLEHGAGPQAWFGPVGAPLAVLQFDERLRDDAAAALDALKNEGIALSLLSGDSAPRVAAMAQALGIEEAIGAASPEHKLAALRAAQQRGEVVAMAGDGVNDAPVLAQADVSFAMGEGALVARAHADAIVVGNRIGAIVQARRLARRTMRVVRQNLLWAAAYNLACVPLALLGLLPPWAAGLGMALSSLLVVGNALRLSR
jgi:P-type Cu2+ transporter